MSIAISRAYRVTIEAPAGALEGDEQGFAEGLFASPEDAIKFVDETWRRWWEERHGR